KSLSSSTTRPDTPTKITSQAAGYLLNWPGLLAMAGILVLAAWNGQAPIVVLTSLLFSSAGLAKLWSHLSLARISCRRQLSERRVFPGEKINVKLQVANRKPLPLPWIQVDDEIPQALGGASTLSGERPGSVLIRRSAAMLWYSSVKWKYELPCLKRGYYPLGPTVISSGDIFGLYSRSLKTAMEDHVIVYPRIFPVGRLPIPSQQPLGESRSEYRVFQDPTRPIGVRDYQHGDSLRHVHWKASARLQALQVKIFEPTTTFKVALFLSVDSFTANGSFNEDAFELGISVAASLAHHVVEQGSPAGVFVNTRGVDSDQPVSLVPSGSRDQLTSILEALAKVTASSSGSFEHFLENEQKVLHAGTTVALIFANPPETLPLLLHSLKENGFKLLLFVIGEGEALPWGEGIPVHRVRNAGDLGGLEA
ncbi:MAG: DUF58 domain-containing protein, partial [Deltaproteobacteria bacterium]|nr:DUF58 domain-containing protein [Deltaproteobacteria bacterium]